MEPGRGWTPSGAQVIYCSTEPARAGRGSRTSEVQSAASIAQCRQPDDFAVSSQETRTGGVR